MSVTGWLTPDGTFVECESYQHIEMVREHPVFARHVPHIGYMVAQLDQEELCHREIAVREGNGNAEWHCYENACDKARYEIRRLLFNAGFMRVGESDGTLYFEGRPNHIRNRYQACKDLADSYGADCVFEPMKD